MLASSYGKLPDVDSFMIMILERKTVLFDS